MPEEQKETRYVDLPHWDDIVHIRPPPTITKEEMEEHRRRKRKKERSNLTERQLHHLQRKRERYIRMKNSPTPEVVKCISKIMTEFDDLEDGLVSAACVARVVVKVLPRLMGRFIPGIGWILLAADVINLFQIISWMPFFAQSAKRTKEGLTERNPLGRKAKLRRLRKIKRIKPTFGEVLEMAQTTDQLWGFGISLGCIMGYVQDAIFGLIQGYKLRSPVDFKVPKARGFFKMMQSTLIANVCDEELTDEEHTSVHVASYMAQQQVKPLMNTFDWFGAADIYSHIPILAHSSMSPSTQYILEEEGEDIEETMRWPIRGTPKWVTLVDLTEELFPKVNASIQSYCERMKKTYEGYVASHCLHEFLYDELLLWEGHNPYSTEFYRREEDVEYSVTLYDGGSRIKNPPAYTYSQAEQDSINKKILEKSETEVERITTIMLENEILPQPDTTPEQLKYFFDRCIAGDRMAQAESGPEEIFDQYVQDIGWPRRAFPVFPKNASHEFIRNQEEMSDMFIENMFFRCKDLWPRWELMPREGIDFYLRYGLL